MVNSAWGSRKYASVNSPECYKTTILNFFNPQLCHSPYSCLVKQLLRVTSLRMLQLCLLSEQLRTSLAVTKLTYLGIFVMLFDLSSALSWVCGEILGVVAVNSLPF